MPPFSSRLAPDDVRVWHAPTSDLTETGVLARAATWLTAGDHARYARLHGDDDRRMFLLGRVMARSLVARAAGTAPGEWQWREGPHGRPEIASPSTPVQFNLAHSAGLVVCALAAGREVGVDVEDLARRPVDPGVVHRYCSAHEIQDIEARGDRWHDRFLRYWTLKEAYLKARGLGIAVTLADVGFSRDDDRPRIVFSGSLAGTDDRWMFHLAAVTDRHLIAVAVSTADGTQPRVTVDRFTVVAALDATIAPSRLLE